MKHGCLQPAVHFGVVTVVEDPERVFRQKWNVDYFTSSEDEISEKDAPAIDLTKQPSHVRRDKGVTKFRGNVSLHAKLQPLVSIKLSNIDRF